MAGTKNTHPHHTLTGTPSRAHPYGPVWVLMPQNPNSVLDPHPRKRPKVGMSSQTQNTHELIVGNSQRFH